MTKASVTLRDQITGAVQRTVQRSDIPAGIPAVQPIAEAVMKEVGPEILNATNNEAWFSSRVTLGAIAGLLGGGYTLVLDFTDGSMPTPDSFTAQIAVIAGAALTLYGRWVARRPLGSAS